MWVTLKYTRLGVPVTVPAVSTKRSMVNWLLGASK